MIEYVTMGLVGALLIALSSLISYEMLRFTWTTLPKLTIHPRLRALWMMGPIFLTHIICIWLYAIATYLVIGYTDLGTLELAKSAKNVPDFILCLYYSAMVYTTVGFGDIIPTKGMEMLAAVESLNGLVMIGWSVSFTYLAMERFWDMPHHNARQKN
ncbi:MAG: ion channel [Rickettsiales bacterium]